MAYLNLETGKYAILASAITDSDVELDVVTGQGANYIPTPCIAVLAANRSLEAIATAEHIRLDSRSTDHYTITRAIVNTAQAYPAGTYLLGFWSPEHFAEIRTAIDNIINGVTFLDSLNIGVTPTVAANPNADDLVITKASGTLGMSFISNDDSICYVLFGDSAASNRGQIYYRHDQDAFYFLTAAAIGMSINSAQDVAIPNGNLTVTGDIAMVGTSGAISLTSGGTRLYMNRTTASATNYITSAATESITFETNGAGNTVMILSAAQDVTIPNGDLTVAGDVKTSGFLNVGAPTELTIAAGVITVTQTNHTVDTEADAATDDLTQINGGSEGDIIILSNVVFGRSVVVKDYVGSPNNILCGTDFTINRPDDKMTLFKRSDGFWQELSRSDNA